MTGVDLLTAVVVLALAAGALVDIWLNGPVFAGWRARVEAWENTLSELLGCSLCLNYQVPIWLTLVLWAPTALGVKHWVAVGLGAVLIMLAAGRLAWIVHAWLGPAYGYDREGPHDEPGDADRR
jgi:hypothetical protein